MNLVMEFEGVQLRNVIIEGINLQKENNDTTPPPPDTFMLL